MCCESLSFASEYSRWRERRSTAATPSRPPSTPSAGSPRRVEPAKGTPTTPAAAKAAADVAVKSSTPGSNGNTRYPRTPSAPPTPSRPSTPGTRTPSAPPMSSRAKTGALSDSKAAREHAKCRRHPRLQLSTSTVEIRCRELRELSESSLLQGISQVCFPLIAILRQLDQLAPRPPPAPSSLLPLALQRPTQPARRFRSAPRARTCVYSRV